MSFVTVAMIGAGGALLGGALSSRGQQQAAATQANAANRAADLQYQQWREQQALQEPWRQSGIAAQNRMLTLLGINPNTSPQIGGGGMGGIGGISGLVANAARSTMAPSSLNVDANSPEFGKLSRSFSETNWQADPGYGFRMSEGMKALDRTAAARGGLMSGAALKGAQRYGQDLASQEYQNAFNRYQTERQALLNPLQSLAGIGQTATNALGTAGQNYATGAGNAYQAAGQATAAGQMGVGNTWNNAIGAGTSAYTNAQLYNRLLGANDQDLSAFAPTTYYGAR